VNEFYFADTVEGLSSLNRSMGCGRRMNGSMFRQRARLMTDAVLRASKQDRQTVSRNAGSRHARTRQQRTSAGALRTALSDALEGCDPSR
jgi:hypothetical protein